MSKFSIEFDWVDAEGIRGPELSATWATLRIVVRDSVVTRILDDRAKTVRDFVYVPLYPLAEWLATNWWFLANEFQNPDKRNDPDFHRRHALNAGREGYAFPNLEIVSSGTRTTLVWKPYAPPWTRVEFLDQGHASVDRLEFRQACRELVDGVIRRLDSRGIDDTLLHEEWTAIQTTEADIEELKFCEAAAGLGWDPYSLDDSKCRDVIALASELGDLIDEAVQVVDTRALRRQASAIVSAIENAKRQVLPLHRLRTSPFEFGQESSNIPPWFVGYDWARKLRLELGLNGRPLPTMATLAEALGEDEDLLHEAMQPAELLTETPLVDGLVTVNDDRSASFAFRQTHEQSRRFSFCRALAELLTARGSGALVTQSSSERQQRNRAFAAEFLAPSHSLQERVTNPVVNGDDIDELAEEFGVSGFVVKHQLDNHGIAHLSDPTVS